MSSAVSKTFTSCFSKGFNKEKVFQKPEKLVEHHLPTLKYLFPHNKELKVLLIRGKHVIFFKNIYFVIFTILELTGITAITKSLNMRIPRNLMVDSITDNTTITPLNTIYKNLIWNLKYNNFYNFSLFGI